MPPRNSHYHAVVLLYLVWNRIKHGLLKDHVVLEIEFNALKVAIVYQEANSALP